MNNKKIKILFVSNTPPIPTQGGAMTFHRHFVSSEDFEVAVITDDQAILEHDVNYPYILVKPGKWWRRLANTRLYRWVHSIYKIIGITKVDTEIMAFARSFGPQAIFSVGGTWNRMAIIAEKLAAEMNVKLIGSFNDWWTYASIHHRWLASSIERRFRAFYRKCDLAICTSEGMREALGEHRNPIVLYPSGASMELRDSFEPATDRFVVGYAGNLGDWYGLMLERLISANKDENIQFRIFGFNASWSDAFNEKVVGEGIYKGKVDFDHLKQEMQHCNTLLLLMGFDDKVAIIEKTSFKTKFLDYLSFRKPIIVWGPEYCSAVRVAKQFDSAEVVNENDPAKVLDQIKILREDSARQIELVNNALNMYEERFKPEKLHQQLKGSIERLVIHHV